MKVGLGPLLLGRLLLGAVALSTACAGSNKPANGPSLAELRQNAAKGGADDSARWLLAEMLEPGGEPKRAEQARAALDKAKGTGLYPALARALDDFAHGHLQAAPESYMEVAKAARESDDPDAPLLAQFAVEQAVRLRGNTQDLWKRWQGWVTESLAHPGHLGWRTRDALTSWWGQEAWEDAAQDIDKKIANNSGCLSEIHVAGPFGGDSVADLLFPHAAEKPGPWPEEWPRDPMFGQTPHQLEVEQKGCVATVDEPVQDGVFYAESSFDVKEAGRAILTANRAIKLWLDGSLIFDRDLREWGSWSKVGVGVVLTPGTHRVVARLAGTETSIRVLREDGTPLPVGDGSGGLPAIAGVGQQFQVNPLRAYINPQGVTPPQSALLRYVAAYLAELDGEHEAANLLMEPLIKDPAKAAGPALGFAAQFIERDPFYDPSQIDDLTRELHARALKRDPKLWASELNSVSHVAQTQGVVDAVKMLRGLTQRYREVPALLGALAKVYGELGWTPEYRRTVAARAQLFPDDVEGLQAAASLYEEEGDLAAAQKTYEQIKKLDPDTEVLIDRALGRRDYAAAELELKRLRDRRPDRKDLEQRLLELKAEAGDSVDPMAMLEAAIGRSPKEGEPYLDLADAQYALGNKDALHNALARASQAEADTAPLNSALDLLSSATPMDPYRLDAKKVIAEYEAKAEHLEGTAARVLDYMAVLVHSDASALMLEHEIIRVQSEEAKTRFAEQELRGGIVLHMRVIKPDGRILEPEAVEGKPTVTLPHLELGDYIETEQLFGSPATPGGIAFEGPQWFFREKDVAYDRSELVLITPAAHPLSIESTGEVPKPVISRDGPFEVRRWRVDKSQAAPDEPFSVPPQEFLPSIKATWGLDVDRHIAMLSRRVEEATPVDPRIVRIAQGILASDSAKPQAELDRARVLYRWVLDNVQEGDEDDGRRVISGKHGNRWRAFTTLCRAVGIPVRWAVARNRLLPDPQGPASSAEQFASTLLRVGGNKTAWVALVDKYTPFGYLPPEVRGTPAYVLGYADSARVTVPEGGERDRLEFLGDVVLEKDGNAELALEQVFAGKFGANLREGLSQLGASRVRDAIEGQVLGANLRGARLVKHELVALDRIDEPLRLKMKAQMAHFALTAGGGLQLPPPYVPRLSQFVSLPTRQTAVLLGTERDWRVVLRIKLPPGARVQLPKPQVFAFGEHKVTIADRVEDGVLVLDRHILLAAGRIPVERYAEFVRFARGADTAMTREIAIRF